MDSRLRGNDVAINSSLDQQRAAGTTGAAGGDHTAMYIPALHLIQQHSSHDGTGGTQGMPEGNHPAVNVQFVVADAEVIAGT